MNTIFFFSRYGSYAASSRLRIVSLFKAIEIDQYQNILQVLIPVNRFSAKTIWAKIVFAYNFIASILHRIRIIIGLKKGDICFVQYELLPFFPLWLEDYIKFKKCHLVLDFDDAFYYAYKSSPFIFLRSKYKFLIQKADLVITGSPALTSYVKQYNKNVVEIPTTVPKLYPTFLENSRDTSFFRIGWIGSETTSIYIEKISQLLREFLQQYPDAQLILIGYVGTDFLPDNQIKVIKWSEENEKAYLPQIDVGLMPLPDDAWSNGKCGFKLIQYMAAGKPTISTPLVANKKIDDGNGNLFAQTNEEWQSALTYFYENKTEASHIGSKNRKRAEDHYVFSAVLPKYKSVIKNILDSAPSV